jgi:hypothetical protein
MRSFILYTPPKLLLIIIIIRGATALTNLGQEDQIKENEVGETCGTHGRGEECVQGVDGKARRKETTWKTKVQMGGCDQNGS